MIAVALIFGSYCGMFEAMVSEEAERSRNFDIIAWRHPGRLARRRR